MGDSERTGQRELGDVVLVERADVLVVGLLGLRLGLRDGKIIGDAGVEALLGFAEGLVGELHVGAGGFNELGGGLDVEDVVADVGVDLLELVGEAGPGLVVLGRGDLLLTASLGDLEDRGGDFSGGGVGAVGVAGGCAKIAKVAVEAGGGKLASPGGGLLGLCAFEGFGGGLEVFAGIEGLLEGGVGIYVIERGVGGGVSEAEALVEGQADGAGEGELILRELVGGGDECLLFVLVVDASAENVESGAGAGVVGGGGLVE